MLEQQRCDQPSRRILQPSAGVTSTWDRSVAEAITNTPCAIAANPVSDLRIAGRLVEPAAAYRVTVNSFLADGGDRFFVLRDGPTAPAEPWTSAGSAR